MTTRLVRHVVICFESEAGIPATPGTVGDLEGTTCVCVLNLKISTNIFRLLFIEGNKILSLCKVENPTSCWLKV